MECWALLGHASIWHRQIHRFAVSGGGFHGECCFPYILMHGPKLSLEGSTRDRGCCNTAEASVMVAALGGAEYVMLGIDL